MRRTISFILLTGFLLAGVPAYADAPGDVTTALESMKQQMTQMQETISRQSQKIQDLESRVAGEPARPSIPLEPQKIQASDIPDSEWQKGIKDNVGEVVTWLKGLKFGGDMRLRTESFSYFDKATETGAATDRSRNRFRLRLRYGFEKDYGDDWKLGFRMATATAGTNGVATDNTSTNVTFSNPGFFTYKNIYIDRAYATYTPNGLKDYGPIQGVTIGAGKFDNPFLRYSTPIVWDGDVTPEGVYERIDFKLVNSEETQLNLQGTAGQFLVNENSGWETDAQIFGWQGAVNLSTYRFGTDLPVDFSTAVSFYDYPNFSQTIGSTNTTSTSFLRTNTSALDNPRVLDIYPEIVFYVDRWPVTLFYNHVDNIGEIRDSLIDTNQIHGEDTAWGLGARLGKLKNQGDWEFHYAYYRIGANAVVAAFNDSDFGGPGGAGFTNRYGHKFGVGWQFAKYAALSWTGYLVTPEDVVTSAVAANAADESVFRSQFDVLWKF